MFTTRLRSLLSRLVWVDDGLAKVVLSEMVVVLAHELHEIPVHPQDDEHLELLVSEQRVALGQHVARAAKYALQGRKSLSRIL